MKEILNSGRKSSSFVLLRIMTVPFVLCAAEGGGLGTCSACPELAARRGGCHAGPRMTRLTTDEGAGV